MSEYSTYGSIMYPAAWPTDVDDPHCTLISFGDNIEALDFGPIDIIGALTDIVWFDGRGTLEANTKGSLSMFGPEQNVPVVELIDPILHAHSDDVRADLRASSITWDQTYPDYRPHVSVGPSSVSETVPSTITLARPQLWWGDERFNL